MGLMSKLRDKIIGRKAEEPAPEFETVRSAILGEAAPPTPSPPAAEIPQPAWRSRYAETAAPREFAPSIEPGLEEARGLEIRQPFGAMEMKREEKWERRDVYELFDRLGIIEAQLAAIRSQTETINERLKMLEIRITRRY